MKTTSKKYALAILLGIIGILAGLVGELFPDSLKTKFEQLFQPISFEIVWGILVLLVLIFTILFIYLYERINTDAQGLEKLLNLIKKGKMISQEDLKKLANSNNFEQVFAMLDKCFAENPQYQYSNLKQNILHELAQGNLPKPAQLQGLLVFLNSEEVKECLEKNIQEQKQETQKATRIINTQNYFEKIEKIENFTLNQSQSNSSQKDG